MELSLVTSSASAARASLALGRLAALALAVSVAGCFSTTAPAAFCTLDASCPETFHCDKAQKRCVAGVTVSVTPATATIGPGAQTQFSALVAGSSNGAVLWSLQEGTGGTLTPSGGTNTTSVNFQSDGKAGTFHVVASSQAYPLSSASAVVTVNTLQLTPGSATINVGRTQQFSANGPGTWSVQEASGGTITTGGLYTAPATAGTYHVSLANASTSVTATATVLPPITIALTPAAPTVAAKGTLQLTATLTNAPPANNGVVWSLQEAGGGAVTAAGLYTAPNLGGTFHVQAVANADPLAAAVLAITVTPPPSVKVTPSPLSMQQGKSQQFTATVTSPPGGNQAVTWSVQEPTGGSINSTGNYVAPNLAGTFHVVATLVADTTVSGSATITVAAGPPSATSSSFTAQPTQAAPVHADGQESFLVTAVLKDSGGTVLPGASIAFAALPGVAFTPSAGSPNAAWSTGVVTGSAASFFAGTADAGGTFSVYVSAATAQTANLVASTCFTFPCTTGAGDLKLAVVFVAAPWRSGSIGIPGVSATGITIDPNNGSRLYLSSSNGVFVSTDKGNTWAASNAGLEGLTVTPVLVAGTASSPILYTTGLQHRTSAGQRSTLFVSADSGATWTARVNPPDTQPPALLALDPSGPNTLWWVTNAVYKTTDGGLTWTTLIQPAQGTNRNYRSLLFDPAKPGSALLLGVNQTTTQTPLLLSTTDGGKTFSQIAAVVTGGTVFPCEANGQSIARDGAGRLVLACGDSRVFNSPDGTTWTQQANVNGGTTLVLGSDKALYAFSAYQLQRSIDGGASWSNVVTSGPFVPGTTGVAVDPADANRVYQALGVSQPGLSAGFAIIQAGAAVLSNTNLGPPAPSTALFALDPSTPAKAVQMVNRTLYRSGDGGATWSATAVAQFNGDFQQLAIDAGGLDGTNPKGGVWAVGNGNVLRLAPGATSWAQLAVPGGARFIRADPAAVGVAYAVGNDPKSFYSTADGGATWQAPTTPPQLTTDPRFYYPVALSALSQGGKTQLYFSVFSGGTPGGFFRSADGGATWITLRNEAADTRVSAGYSPDAANPSLFYYDIQGISQKTTDSFATHSPITVNGNTNAFFRAADPLIANKVWSGVYGQTGPQIYVSTDAAATWTRADTGLGTQTFAFNGSTDMYFGPSGLTFISNYGRGLSRSTTGGL